MTRLLIMADPHIGATHLTTLAEQAEALGRVVAIAKSEKVDVVAIAGDGTHHARPTPEALAVLGSFYAEVERLGLVLVEIAGNHNPHVPAVSRHFRGNVCVALEPTLVRLPLLNLDVACLPWLPDSWVRAGSGGAMTREETAHALTGKAVEILRGFVAQKQPGVPLILLAHATIAGATTSSGWSMGFVPGTEWVIPLAALEGFDLVAAGHIHKAQEIVGAPSSVVVPGSLLPLDFSETEPKCVVIADVGRPLGGVVWRFVDIPTPQVSTWDLEGVDVRAMVEGTLADLGAVVESGEKIRVRVNCDEATAREFPPSRIAASIYTAGASLVQVELDVTRPDRVKAQGGEDLAPVQALGRYLATREDLATEARERVLFHGVSTIERLRASGAPGGDVELRAIEARDFLGLREAAVEFDGHGVYALTGPVGAGKSTIGADVPRFALFGASRYGAKVSDRVVRQGADLASASVELAGVDGEVYRVTRKVKRVARGATSTLDVLRFHPADVDGDKLTTGGWRPLSSGKVADGQAVVDRILGGLDDRALSSSSIVIQREADALMRARPEERKQILAQAAGLGTFDELAELARETLRAAEGTLAALQAKAEPLRTRAEAVPGVERSLDQAVDDAGIATRAIERLEAEAAELRAEADRLDKVAEDAERLLNETRALQGDIASVSAEVNEWTKKRTVADALVAQRATLERAREDLEAARSAVKPLEAALVFAAEQVRLRSDAIMARADLEQHLAGMRRARERTAADLQSQVVTATRQAERLDASECPVVERISAGELPACVFLRDARRDVSARPALVERLHTVTDTPAPELALAEQLAAIVIPADPDTRSLSERLAGGLERVRSLEKQVAVAEKIAAAEEVIRQHDEAVAKLNARNADLRKRLDEKNTTLLAFPPDARGSANRARTSWESATFEVTAARTRARDAEARASELRGRLASLREARHELEEIEQGVAIAAADVGALEVLVVAWRACRVNVLEAAVIPSVEDTANDVLRRFPYGLQIRLATQRERRSGEGVSEALDVEVLGGHAPVYEGCSGGQRTTIDFALHVAIALVVSRRASARLRFLFCDEPEGLDEPGRAAFAATARWIHETFGLTVVVASHAADLIDALGARRFELVQGEDGATIREAA